MSLEGDINKPALSPISTGTWISFSLSEQDV